MGINRKSLFFLYLFVIAGFISCKEKDTVFKHLNASTTNIEFENIPVSHEELNILYYIYYYNGAGVATGDINNDGLDDIYFASNDRGKNKLYLNKGNFEFEDITMKAGVAGVSDWCTGVTMADVNADGYLDIYVCAVSNKNGLFGFNELYINNGNGLFTESAAVYGLNFSGYSTQSAFFDYDHDGDLDCYLLNQSDRPHQYIVDTSFRKRFDANAGDRLFRNDMVTSTGGKKSQPKFIDVSAQSGIYQSSLGYGLGLAVGDINNDGWEDIYVGNDFHENDYYYVNNGNGSFTESGAKFFNHYSRFSMGNDLADYNNDGNLDVLTLDMLPADEKILKTYGSDERADIYNFKIINKGYQHQFSRNCLQRNNGNGKSFSDIGLAAGISATDWSWSPLVADFDNDGYKDIFISSGIVQRPVDLDYVKFVSDLARQKSQNASLNLDETALEKMPEGSSYCFLFKGNGKGNFTDKSKEWGIADKKGFFTGAAYADFNNDGNLDIVVNPIHSKAFIYQNTSPRKNYLQIKFQGDTLNPFGIGAKAYVFQKEKMQFQQLMLTRGFQSSSFARLHFGLDTTASIDSLWIVWPDSSFQVLRQAEVNKVIVIDKKLAAGKFVFDTFFPQPVENFLKLSSLLSGEGFKHREDAFDDFSAQYLIPHSLSGRGPKLAVADVNKDGLEDFYVCGPIGQPGKLFIQGKTGKFQSADTSVFSIDANCEDVDAVFFDANQDGYPDLYVVSGGNYYSGNSIYLLDRLYMNDRKGHFQKSSGLLPELFANKSCVSAADIDGDKDADLFVGTLAAPRGYGLPQTSYLLLNKGNGVFDVADDAMINLKNIGMVTGAAINDVNKDGANDLIMAGEWMPVTVFLNNGNKFSPVKLTGGTGLWQCLQICDVNRDGFIDILAGNWGLNSKLAAGKTGSLKMYIKDFDKNGTTDPILTYSINNVEYSFLPKDELEQVLPMLKKKFLYYTDFAGKPVQEVFDVGSGNLLTLEANNLASAVFINDGKGNFSRKNLPMDLQLTPIFSFQQGMYNHSWFAGGNFYGVLPYEGEYDAAAWIHFEMNHSEVTRSRVLDIKGQVRDMKWIHTATNGNVLMVARNNDSILFYKNNNEKN